MAGTILVVAGMYGDVAAQMEADEGVEFVATQVGFCLLGLLVLGSRREHERMYALVHARAFWRIFIRIFVPIK